MNDAEVGFVLELTRFLELGVCALLLLHFVNKGFVGGFGEPALLIQQSEDTGGVRLRREKSIEYTLFLT